MHRKHTTAEDGVKTARSVSQSRKTLRRHLSFRPVAVMAAACAAFLTTGLAAGAFAGTAGAATAPHETSHALSTTGLGYTALPTPVRIADTRAGAIDPATYAGKTLAEGGSQTIDIPASSGVPINAGAVVVNVTAILPTKAGFLTVSPGGSAPSTAANVTFGAGQTVGNLVTVGLGTDATTTAAQSFTVFNGPASNGGTVDFTADVVGYYAPQTGTAGAPYVGLSTPTRIFDTRTGSGEPGAGTTLTNGGSTNVPVITAASGVPTSATGVVLNVAVTNATSSSFISAYPTGATVPGTASQNFVAGETLSSQVISGIGTGGDVTIANHSGNVDVVVDVDGYFAAQGATGSLFNALPAPVRLTDTRPTGVAGGASSGSAVQGAGATAGVLSIADIATIGSGNFLTAYPAGSTAPLAANVNYVPGDTYNIVENATYATTGAGGSVNVLNGPANAATANIVVDEDGYFAPPSAAAAYTVTTTSPAQVTVSNTATPSNNAGDVTYTATGLPTAAGTTADIALFPGSGPNAPKGNVFTDSSTTATAAAAGQGTTNTSNADIVSVNGVPVTVAATAYGAAPQNGTLTFVVNSTAPDSAIPVVFTGPSTTLTATTAGAPATGYAAGTGTATTWNAAAAPNGPTTTVNGVANSGGYLVVSLVNTAAGTFQACTPTAATSPQTGYVPSSTCSTYTYTNAGDTYAYPDPAENLTAAQFGLVLSGAATQTGVPAADVAINGDELAEFNYNSTGPTAFSFYVTGNGDVPAAPTGLGAVAGTAANSVVLTWSAPPNPDVAGSVAGTGNAVGSYEIYRQVAGSTGGYTAYASVAGTVTTYTDTAAAAGTSYIYAVSATAAVNGGGQQGPISAPFTFAPPAGTGATTPAIVSVVITASTAGTLNTSTGATTGGTAGTALITYSVPATCTSPGLAGPAFTYSNTAGSGSVAAASCAQTTTTTVTVTFPQATGPVAAVYSPVVIAAPASGDTYKYTAPGAPATTANSIYAGPTANPQFELTQTVVDSGNPTNITSAGSPPSNPLT